MQLAIIKKNELIERSSVPLKTVGVALFEGFEVLDVFGPVELLSSVPDGFDITFHARSRGLVKSSQGVEVKAECSFEDLVDIVLVPGGRGTRALVDDDAFCAELAEWISHAKLVSSVCTGSALLAATGLLDARRATSNKKAFDWASSFGTDVEWIRTARWVRDRDFWTSSGVAAGMDMTVAIIGELLGQEAASLACQHAEYEPHTDAGWDPFAELYQQD